MLHAFLATGRMLLIGVILVTLIGPTVFKWVSGQQLVSVDGGSMAPTYLYGDIVLLTPPTGDDLVVDAVVTMRDETGVVYTHRIIAVDGAEATTQGDANSSADVTKLVQRQVVGTVTGVVSQPVAGLLRSTESLPARLFLLAIVVGLAVLPLPGRRRAASV